MSPSTSNILCRSKETIARLMGKSRFDSRSSTSRRKPIARLAMECLEVRELMTAGYFDTTFNQTGKEAISFASANPHASAVAEAVAIQANGKIVIAGEVSPAASSGDIGVMRLNANGTLDSSFGTNGRA